jgi:hypothetical protein
LFNHFVQVSRFVDIRAIVSSHVGETITDDWKFQLDSLVIARHDPVASDAFWFIAFQKFLSKVYGMDSKWTGCDFGLFGAIVGDRICRDKHLTADFRVFPRIRPGRYDEKNRLIPVTVKP